MTITKRGTTVDREAGKEIFAQDGEPTVERRKKPRRASDRRFHFLRENWYRDVWLFIISAVVAAIAFHVVGVADDLVATRRTAVRDACNADNVQADVMRTILQSSLDQQRRIEKAGKLPPGAIHEDEAVALLDKLMAPLGGFHPSEAQKKALCDARVRRGSPP